MARQRDVLGEREFVSESRQWYRTIGTGRYRFRSTHRDDGSAKCTVEIFVEWSVWSPVHNFTRPKTTGFES